MYKVLIYPWDVFSGSILKAKTNTKISVEVWIVLRKIRVKLKNKTVPFRLQIKNL